MAIELWASIKKEIGELVMQEPEMGTFYSRRILQHDSLALALSELLALKLATADLPVSTNRPEDF